MDFFIIIFISIFSVMLFSVSILLSYRIFGIGLFKDLGISCVTIIEKNDNVEERLSDIINSMESECLLSDTKVIIIDGGIDIGQIEICRKYCDKYEFLKFCTPDNLSELIFNIKSVKRYINKG